MLSFNLQGFLLHAVFASGCASVLSVCLRWCWGSSAPLCQRSLGQSRRCRGPLKRGYKKKKDVRDQRTCRVISARLVAGGPYGERCSCQSSLTQMNAVSISGCIKSTDAASGNMSPQQLNHPRWGFFFLSSYLEED